jgi:predicted phage terminase large subunit-like protein
MPSVAELKNAAQQVLIAERELYRSDFGAFFRAAWEESLEPRVPFTNSPHYDLLFEYAQAIGTGAFKELYPDKQGLIINIPPRTLKSLAFNVALPAWVWTHSPEKRFLTVSYGKDLAISFSVKRRDLMRTKWYQSHFPEVKIKEDADLKDRYDNDKTGYMVCGSPGAISTGTGGNIIIIDDLLKADDAFSKLSRESANKFYDNALTSRRNNPAEDVYLIVCQRLHEGDIVGHLLKNEPDEWVVLDIPMEAEEERVYRFPITDRTWRRKVGHTLLPERFTPAWIKREKRRPRVWSGQYQQQPSPAGGFIFDPDRWGFYDPTAAKIDPETQLMSIDCAWKDAQENDLTAIHVYGVSGVKRWLLHRYTQHIGYVVLLDKVRELRKQFPKISYVLVEEAANGYAVIKQLSEEMTGIVPIKPEGGKVSRAIAASADMPNVFIPMPERETWVQREWIDNFAHFTDEGSIEHDDDIDAYSQAMNWLRSRFWGTELLDKQYDEVTRKENAAAGIELAKPGTCRACGSPAAVDESAGTWACSICKARGRLGSRAYQKTGF